ncbi:embryonic polarity protein dorsal [Trichonephila inaurata madagascariensis]|uniref:Embryonic polarity protein dorsal n=1 Tax=Trichonephila inaurata madagascariensis TaxID=2747483 RepID=A0A8X7CQV1_9ARAC|nr:embryonic polarity protein dorsal [Trichonephila inaurata madagascariensis]
MEIYENFSLSSHIVVMFSPVDAVSHALPPQPVGRMPGYNYIAQEEPSFTPNRAPSPFVEILEQPVSIGARFRYKCEGRSAGCIRGINSSDKQKTYPTIKVHGYQGAAGVVVSCVTKDGPPYYPHPHNLVGKTCTNGVCYKSINTPDMVCSFANLGIQCVKKKEIKESLSQREEIKVDPFGTGFSHHLEPNKINLNALRLCFQVFLPDEHGKLCFPLPPVISNPIFDNKTISDLTITKLSHYSAPVTGGQEVILLCDQVNKDDIQILFYEENDNKIIWCDHGKFAPHHVHRKAAISFQTPAYKNINLQHSAECFIQLRRPSDGAVGKPRNFTFLPLKQDPEGLARKRNKFEALRLDRILQPNNLPTNNANRSVLPRLIKHAVRSKSFQSGPGNNFQRNFVPENDYQMQISPSMHEDVNFIANIGVHSQNPHNSNSMSGAIMSSNSQSCSPRQKVEDILAVAKEQIGMNNSQGFCETASDETLDRLSSLDLGIDPNDLDVNLSGITLDSFSETSGLNFTAPLMETKNTSDKL